MPRKKKPTIVEGPFRVVAMQAAVDPKRFVPKDILVLQSFRDGNACSNSVHYEPGNAIDLATNLEKAVSELTPERPPRASDENKVLTWLVDKLRGSIASNDCHESAIIGVRIGLLAQWLALSPFDADTIRGMKTIRSARRGHVKTHGTTEERQKRHDAYLADWNAVRAKHPEWSVTAVDQEVASIHKVNVRTIQRARPKTR